MFYAYIPLFSYMGANLGQMPAAAARDSRRRLGYGTYQNFLFKLPLLFQAQNFFFGIFKQIFFGLQNVKKTTEVSSAVILSDLFFFVAEPRPKVFIKIVVLREQNLCSLSFFCKDSFSLKLAQKHVNYLQTYPHLFNEKFTFVFRTKHIV